MNPVLAGRVRLRKFIADSVRSTKARPAGGGNLAGLDLRSELLSGHQGWPAPGQQLDAGMAQETAIQS
jgi:hypothetical protein